MCKKKFGQFYKMGFNMYFAHNQRIKTLQNGPQNDDEVQYIQQTNEFINYICTGEKTFKGFFQT